MMIGLLTLCGVAHLKLFAQSHNLSAPKSPLEIDGYNWETNAREWKLTPEEIDALKQRGFLITQKSYRQIFEPYVFGSQVFITSDTVINAYSVLLEDSLLRLEAMNARRLRNFLEGAWSRLDGIENRFTGDKVLLGAAAERARTVIGVALQLASGEKVKAAPELAKKINEEAQRVIAAEGQGKPEWLGKPDAGFMAIDYTRFKPRGFYSGNASLERHFRAVSWLQAIPFRYDNEEECTAFLYLYAMRDGRDASFQDLVQQMGAVKAAYTMLLGEADNGDLFGRGYGGGPGSNTDLSKLRKWFIIDEPKGGPQINDQIALRTKDGKSERSFRILAARSLPDSLLFTKTSDIRKGAFPCGLEVAAAMGSQAAVRLLQSSSPELLKAIDSNKMRAGRGSLYASYLECLSLLFMQADPAAPKLFQSPAWEVKSLQTFLGGWAQARHAWNLQTKQNVEYLGGGMPVPCGFVEPVPDFFAKMGWLAERSMEAFSMSGAHESTESNWYQLANLCTKLEALSQKQLRGSPFNTDDNDFIDSYGERLGGIMFYGGNSYENPRDDAPRICDIYTDPAVGRILNAGVGKPVQIYVLYPYGGKTILTHGAVFPYYEFASTERLTDKEWRVLQCSPAAPAQPAWLNELQGK